MTNKNDSKINEIDFLFKQYVMLIELMQYHHARWNNHLTRYLSFVTIIAGAIGLLLTNQPTSCIIILLALIGVIICVAAIISLNRIRNDSRLKFSQINRIEEKICAYSKDNSLYFIPHSTEAQSFFDGHEVQGVVFSPKCLRHFRHLSLIIIIFSFFALYFIGGIINVLFFRCSKITEIIDLILKNICT